MAPKKSDPIGGGEKEGTIEIAYVKLAGNNATLQEAVRAFNALINRSTNGNALAARRVNALPVANTKAPVNGNESSTVENESIEVETNDEEVEEDSQAAAPRSPRRYSMPTAIAIDTESGTSVDAFVKQYKLESNEEKYLALAGWLKTHRGATPLKAGHVVMLFKHLDWALPVDVTMPLRRMVNKKLQWLERTSVGEYQIHQVGESKLAKLKV